MARYNSVNTTSSVAGGSVITSPASGLLTTLTGSGTVTVPNPVFYTGQTQSFYNSTGAAITLNTTSGAFTGPGFGGGSTLSLPAGSIITLVSDGTNYIGQSWLGGTVVASGTFTATGAVSMSPTGLNVSIQPTGAGVLTLSSGTKGSLDNVDIGTTTAGNAKFGTLESSGITKVTATTVSTTYQDGALIVSGGVGIAKKLFVNDSIKAGSASATNGSIIIQANYSDGSLTTFGSEYSSGGPSLGYAVYPSSSASGAFLSASGATNLQRGAYNINGSTHNWYAGASSTVAIGSSVSMYNAMSLSTTALTVSNAANVVIQNPTSSPVNSQSPPGYLQFTGYGWNTLVGSTSYQGQIALGGTYSGASGSTEPAFTFSLAGTGNGGYNTANGPSSLTERMRITNYGFVGIGNTTPSNTLDVTTTSPAVNTATANNLAGIGGGITITSNQSGTNSRVGIVMRGSDNIGGGIAVARQDAGTTWGTYMAFYTNNQTSGSYGVSAVQEKLRITSDGLLSLSGTYGTAGIAFPTQTDGSLQSTYPTFMGYNWKFLGAFTLRNGSQYLDIQTNFTGGMVSVKAEGYLYNQLLCVSYSCGYTYTSNQFLARQDLNLSSNTTMSLYRSSASPYYMGIRFNRGTTGYTEGQINVYINAWDGGSQNAISVLQFAQNNTASQYY